MTASDWRTVVSRYGFELVSDDGVRIRFRVKSGCYLAMLPREILEKLAGYELVELDYGGTVVYVRGQEVRKLLDKLAGQP